MAAQRSLNTAKFKFAVIIIVIGLMGAASLRLRNSVVDRPSEPVDLFGSSEVEDGAQAVILKGNMRIGENELSLESADTAEEQARGLSGRSVLPENAGMIFRYTEEVRPRIWMKDMLFGIDIIWVSADGRVSEITKNVLPETFPSTFSPQQDVKFVIEVNAGYADRHGVQVGDQLEAIL